MSQNVAPRMELTAVFSMRKNALLTSERRSARSGSVRTECAARRVDAAATGPFDPAVFLAGSSSGTEGKVRAQVFESLRTSGSVPCFTSAYTDAAAYAPSPPHQEENVRISAVFHWSR